ncbi:ABC transporter permease subunit [Pelagicoccus sp. SDUM812005]|uniref:ABC transporter permease subunit n=1 Tax=Pelagicoccus sp. SDUM812005 TaxID=3041257 RepID=UPI00280F9FBF|nr:ABC transporter permease subunit [Pelagicoccus sp. SDUM812005]MDQ8183277.1 ABC transporter permease subunit [Pelagicoccus sp. SDUM812005]
MAESTKDKIKYRILKTLDVSGFTAFDPVIRLIFGEEPQKQFAAIVKYLVIPAFFVLSCIWFWSWIGPRHKTKSGEVPTPDIVWESVQINDTIAEREKVKRSDFQLKGAEREAALEQVAREYEILSEEVKAAKALVAEKEAEKKAREEKLIAPLEAKYESLKSEYRDAAKARDAEIARISEEVSEGKLEASALIAAIRNDGIATDRERSELNSYKSRIDEIRSQKYKPLDQARKQYDSVADKQFFMKTRLEFLDDRNLYVKLDEAQSELNEYMAELSTAGSAKDALKIAKRAVRAEESVARLEGQEYASAVTIYHQTKRSIFTVFVGFFMAAFVAIPVGIMCGLNKIFMACMTPIISVFKPVSPVVWLLIFQIVVGAFFPDPENHALLNFLNNLPLISSLEINPALIFSACTVAMCAVWPALVNTALGVASIDQDHVNVARVLRLGFWSRLFKIVIPSALPLVFAGLRISLGVGWMVLIAAEALSSSDGLGKFVWDEYQNGSSLTFANIIMVCFVVGIIGFFLDRMMIILQRFVSFDGGGTSV